MMSRQARHHVCVDWQSRLERLRHKVGLDSLNAEPGKVYYYEIKVRSLPSKNVEYLALAAVNDDEGRYRVKIEPLAAATKKK